MFVKKFSENINALISPDKIVLSEQYFQMTLINKLLMMK